MCKSQVWLQERFPGIWLRGRGGRSFELLDQARSQTCQGQGRWGEGGMMGFPQVPLQANSTKGPPLAIRRRIASRCLFNSIGSKSCGPSMASAKTQVFQLHDSAYKIAFVGSSPKNWFHLEGHQSRLHTARIDPARLCGFCVQSCP